MIILNSSYNPELTTQSEDPKLGHNCSDLFGWEFAHRVLGIQMAISLEGYCLTYHIPLSDTVLSSALVYSNVGFLSHRP